MYTIDDKMLKFGELMMDELGLYADPTGLVCDQDNDNPICINGKNLIYASNPGVTVDKRSEVLFDPLNNPTIGRYLFGFYAEHRCDTPIGGFSTMPDLNNKDKGIIRVETNEEILVETSPYYSDSCKYADAIMRLNGDDNPDLSKFDGPVEKNKRRR